MTELVFIKPKVLPPKGLLIALVSQAPLLVLATPLRPSTLNIVMGALFLVAGTTTMVWAERIFRRDHVGVCPFTPVSLLITRGPFRVTRNPMYLGLVCIAVSVALMTGVWANLWSAVSLMIWLHYAFVLPEEAFLRRELGATFDDYARRVPRWLFPLRTH